MTFQPLPDDLAGLKAALTEKLKQGSDKMREHDVAIEELKEANRKQDEKLEKIEHNTSTLVEIFMAGRGTFKFAGWIGKLVVWFGSISGAIYAIWFALTNWPHKGG